MSPKIAGQVRHWAGIVGGVLVGLGIATAEDVTAMVQHVETLAGAGAALVALVLSWRAPEKAGKS